MDVPIIPYMYLLSIAVFGTAVILLLQLYINRLLAELKAEYINAEEFCRAANIVLPLKVLLHGLLAILYFGNDYIVLFSINFAVLFMQLDALCTLDYFNVYDIMEPGQITSQIKYSRLYSIFYVVCLIGYMVCIIAGPDYWENLNLEPRPPFGVIAG